jgi:hypothetical protein
MQVKRGAYRDLRPAGWVFMAGLVALAVAITSLAPTATAQTTTPTGADLSVMLVEAADPVGPGASTSVAATISNSGSVASTGGHLVVMVDPSAVFTSAAPSVCSHDSGLVYCAFSGLAQGATTTITLFMTAPQQGPMLTGAILEPNEVDPDGSNDVWTEDTEISSGPAPEPTPEPAPESIVLRASDDSFVKSTLPNRNFGGLTTLETDADPRKVILMKFDLSGVSSVASAKLRMFAVDGSPDGGAVYGSDSSNWSEATVTYRSRPRWGSTPGPSFGPVAAGSFYEVDVTDLVNGGGPVTLFVLTSSSDQADYSSDEGASPPQLIVTAATQAASRRAGR